MAHLGRVPVLFHLEVVMRAPVLRSCFALLCGVSTALALTSDARAQGANECASAEALKGYGTFAVTNVGATTDGLPDTLCNFFNNQQVFNDVWFVWTAPETSVVDVTTCALATWDSKIAIYHEACLSAAIACNDDACALQTRVRFSTEGGVSYLIRVGSYGAGISGSGSFSIQPMAFEADITDKVTGNRYVAVSGLSFNAAESLGVALGGHLTSIGDAAEQEFVHANFGNLAGVDRRIWIGFTDFGNEGVFSWTDGTPAKYTNWNAGEPNNSSGVEHYAEMFGSTGQWNDLQESGGTYAHLAVIEIAGGGGGSNCLGDLNGDTIIDAPDLAILLSSWGIPGAPGDLNGDTIVDAADLAMLLSLWGNCPE